ncbi:MAG: hypothetical protein WC244_02755 [Patescibacteria group bacterium]|jgi:hypothetical protein
MDNCPLCQQPLTIYMGKVGGIGFGSQERLGNVAGCRNPNCQIGKVNLRLQQEEEEKKNKTQ